MGRVVRPVCHDGPTAVLATVPFCREIRQVRRLGVAVQPLRGDDISTGWAPLEIRADNAIMSVAVV